MTDRWFAATDDADEKRWFIRKGGVQRAENAAGRVRTFASADAAELAAGKLNRAEGMSAFEDISADVAARVQKRLLAGDTLAEVRAIAPNLPPGRLNWMRDEVFVALVSNPAAVKALADGPLLNPSAIVKYTHSRQTIHRAAVKQAEMFPA